MHVHKRCAVVGRNTKFVLQQCNALLTNLWAWPSKIGEVRGVHGERAEAVLFHSRAELRQLLWEFSATRPAGWVTSKDLEAHGANCCSAIRRLQQPWANGKVCAEHAIEPSCGGGWGGALQFARCCHARILSQGSLFVRDTHSANPRDSRRAQYARRLAHRCAARLHVINQDHRPRQHRAVA